VRARRSGVFRSDTRLGDRVAAGEEIGSITDTFGRLSSRVQARGAGVVIGLSTNPLVNRGDALVHVGEKEAPPEVRRTKRKSARRA
jgi:predicted deacylase